MMIMTYPSAISILWNSQYQIVLINILNSLGLHEFVTGKHYSNYIHPNISIRGDNNNPSIGSHAMQRNHERVAFTNDIFAVHIIYLFITRAGSYDKFISSWNVVMSE